MSGRILVVDDVPTNRVLLKAKLSSAYYNVTTAESGEEAIEIAKRDLPDMILLDVLMPRLDGFHVCEVLKADPDTAHIPIVMMTAMDSPEERIRGLESGADDFIAKPVDDLTLFARARNLMRVKIMFDELRLRDETSRELGLHQFVEDPPDAIDDSGVVLMVAATPGDKMEWRSALQGQLKVKILEADGERAAVDCAASEQPDLCLIQNTLMDGNSGLRLVSALRADPASRTLPIIYVTAKGDLETAAAALDLGASDYIFAPFDPNELCVRVRSQIRRKKYSDRLRSNVIDGLKMAVIDPLTQIYNRRYAMQHLRTIMDRSAQENSEFSVLMMDLDSFKAVNDTYGHDVGDSVLKEFAYRVQTSVRGIDLVARLGGEEFCVAMPDTDVESAAFVAERVRAAIQSAPFANPTDPSNPIAITVSIGVSVGEGTSQSPEGIIRQADHALYAAKNSGRNTVSIYSVAA